MADVKRGVPIRKGAAQDIDVQEDQRFLLANNIASLDDEDDSFPDD
jgi:hypothetical protein